MITLIDVSQTTMLHVLVFAFVFAIKVSGQDDAGASACGSVLQNGIYNTISSSSSSVTYATFQTTLCTYSSSYSFKDYQQDYSSMSSNSEWKNIEASASYMGIGASVGVSGGSSHLSASQFSTFQNAASSYQSSQCGSSSGTSGSSSNIANFEQFVNPQVWTAYQSCLTLYATGVRISDKAGSATNANSVYLDIVFVNTGTPNGEAFLTGLTIAPAGAATCHLYGHKLPKGSSTSFMLQLEEAQTYSVACTSKNTKGVHVVDVSIHTSPGGTYLTHLYNAPIPTQLTDVIAQVAGLQQQLTTIQDQINNNLKVSILTVSEFIVTPQIIIGNFPTDAFSVGVEDTALVIYDPSGKYRTAFYPGYNIDNSVVAGLFDQGGTSSNIYVNTLDVSEFIITPQIIIGNFPTDAFSVGIEDTALVIDDPSGDYRTAFWPGYNMDNSVVAPEVAKYNAGQLWADNSAYLIAVGTDGCLRLLQNNNSFIQNIGNCPPQ